MSNPIAYREYIHLLPHLFFVKVEKQFPGEGCVACDDVFTPQLFECNTCTLRLCEPCRDRIVDRHHMGSLTKLIQNVASWKLRYQNPIGIGIGIGQHQRPEQIGGGLVNHQAVIMMMQEEHGQQQSQHQHQFQIHHQQQQQELQRIQQLRQQEGLEEQQMMLRMDGGLRTQRKFVEMMQKIQSEIEMEAELESTNNMSGGMRGRSTMGGSS